MKIQATLAAFLLAAAPAFADGHMGAMEDFDGDGDMMLNDAEFGEAEGNRRFLSYDADGDGTVTEDEFRAGEFRRYDRDGDSMIDDEEYVRLGDDMQFGIES